MLHSTYIYGNLLKVRPWAMNLSGSSKRGVGLFSSVLIFHPKISHTLQMYANVVDLVL